LRESLGKFPPPRPPLDVRVSARYSGKGYTLENLVFQSRPGVYVTANLYLPEKPLVPMPGIIIVHSQHAPKTQIELQDSGEVWARAGCAVLIIERPGYGERTETSPWYRHAYASRFLLSKQLLLAGESYSAWAAWDTIRGVDFLLERPGIDPKRIILIGAVAGGGEIAGIAAALDDRITAAVPYNYDQGQTRVHGDSHAQIVKQFFPWLVIASTAPRKYVRAFEFAWESAGPTDSPSLWVDAMARSEKVWGFYGARDSLAAVEGYGRLGIAAGRRTPCQSIGPEHRETLYPLFERWFGIPWPSAEDRAILPYSLLSSHEDRAAARRQEAQRQRPHAQLLSITPALAEKLQRKPMHAVALEMARESLQAARSRRQPLAPAERMATLRRELVPLLGDIEPASTAQAETHWKRSLDAASVEAVSLTVEDGIRVPLLLLLPKLDAVRGAVVAVAHGGKGRFLTGRAREIRTLLGAGLAVCLPDVRGTGETLFDGDHDSDSAPALREFDLGRSLLGSRLKDLRAVIAHVRRHPALAGKAIGLWGDSFSPPNPPDLYLDEVDQEAGPQFQRSTDPLGSHLVLLAALYEEDVRAVAARGSLAGYLSVLEQPFTYTPMHVIVRGILRSADIADIAAAVAPRPVAIADAVDGRNILVPATALRQTFEPTRRAYEQARSRGGFTLEVSADQLAAWLAAQMKKRP
jgi:cephalosporin-C deacetylase-like acetyl esterase